ncbi:MAG: NAD(P)H-dependent oxidoreductase [Actinocatenispora sp.]
MTAIPTPQQPKVDRPGGTAPSLLHLDSSASGTGDSVSRQLTALYADTWRRLSGPAADHRYRDLAADPVAPISAAYVALGYRVERHGDVPTAEVGAFVDGAAEQREWAATLPLVTELLAAETLLLGVPMYNLSVPASLKAWIDRVSFPGVFVDPDTGTGLLRRARIVVLGARGGAYGPGSRGAGLDFQETYLRAYFGKLGVPGDRLSFVHAEMTRSGDRPELARFRDQARGSLADARSAVTALARQHAADRLAVR